METQKTQALSRPKTEKMISARFALKYGERVETFKIVADVLKTRGVRDDKALAAAVELSAKARGLQREIEKLYKETVAPFEKHRKAARQASKSLKDRCQAIITGLEEATKPYLDLKEQSRRQRQAQAEKRQAQALKDAAETGETPLIIPEVVPDQTRIVTGSGSVSIKEELRPEVVDLLEAVKNPEFVAFRQKLLEEHVLIYARQCLKLGRVNIPGVVFNRVNVQRKYTK